MFDFCIMRRYNTNINNGKEDFKMKNVKDLNTEELKLVFENNSKLQEKVFDDMFDNANFWNGEYLDCWNRKGIEYYIGWDRGTYFKSKDNELFIDGLKEVQRIYCFLADKYNKKIEYVEKLLNKLNYLYYNSSEENYNRLEMRIDELIEELETACYDRFMSEYEYCFDSKNQLDYFLNFYADERMNNDFYVDEEYILFEHVEYVKSYN